MCVLEKVGGEAGWGTGGHREDPRNSSREMLPRGHPSSQTVSNVWLKKKKKSQALLLCLLPTRTAEF